MADISLAKITGTSFRRLRKLTSDLATVFHSLVIGIVFQKTSNPLRNSVSGIVSEVCHKKWSPAASNPRLSVLDSANPEDPS
jgi:hypothetical protein